MSLRALFSRKPTDRAEDYTASHLGRGDDYEENFSRYPVRRTLWDLEQAALVDIISTIPPPRFVLDLACGTGRVCGFLESLAPVPERIVGVDVSESMLAVARGRCERAQFANIDVRVLVDAYGSAQVDLVTAFRFFPNADNELRLAAAEQVSKVLEPNGYLVVNNHRNFWSTSYILRRIPHGAATPGALNADLVKLFEKNGLRLESTRSLGLWPHTESKPYGLSLKWFLRLERVNARRLAKYHRLGSDVLLVFRKAEEGGAD